VYSIAAKTQEMILNAAAALGTTDGVSSSGEPIDLSGEWRRASIYDLLSHEYTRTAEEAKGHQNRVENYEITAETELPRARESARMRMKVLHPDTVKQAYLQQFRHEMPPLFLDSAIVHFDTVKKALKQFEQLHELRQKAARGETGGENAPVAADDVLAKTELPVAKAKNLLGFLGMKPAAETEVAPQANPEELIAAAAATEATGDEDEEGDEAPTAETTSVAPAADAQPEPEPSSTPAGSPVAETPVAQAALEVTTAVIEQATASAAAVVYTTAELDELAAADLNKTAEEYAALGTQTRAMHRRRVQTKLKQKNPQVRFIA
jgi:hypothetical protein